MAPNDIYGVFFQATSGGTELIPANYYTSEADANVDREERGSASPDVSGQFIVEKVDQGDFITASGDFVKQAANQGAGKGIYASKAVDTLNLKSLVGSAGLSLTETSDEITFTNDTQVDFTNSSGIFQAGTNTADVTSTDFTNSSGVFIKDGVSWGSGSGVYGAKFDQQIRIKSLIPGTNIGINDQGNALEIYSPGGAGETNKGGNVGQGIGVYDGKAGVTLNFRGVLGGSGIQVGLSGQTVRFDSHLLDDLTNLETDYSNSSGVFQAGTNTANQVDTDFNNASGLFYRKDENLTPISTDTYDIGSSSARFNDIYAGSGNFIDGIGNDGDWNISPSGRQTVRTSSSPFVTLTSAATINVDFTQGYNFKVALGTNATFVFHNPADGERYLFHIKQDATGGRTLAWPSTVLWPSGNAPVITSSGLARDVVTLFYDAGDDIYLGGFSQSFF